MPTFMHPFPRGTRKSQGFREYPGGYNPVGGHTGDDYAVPVGTPVRAPHDGIIRLSSWVTDNFLANDWWLTSYGGDMLVLDTMDSFGITDTMPTFIFAHLSNSKAEVGERVKKGQIIGYTGNTGTATSGPHCHVEALPPNWDWNNGVYGRVAPDDYFSEFYEDMQSEVELALQAANVKPLPAPTKETEMPTFKRISSAKFPPHRLPKGGVYRLSAKDDGLNQNFAVCGVGYYLINLFVSGEKLSAGEVIEVTFEVVRNGVPSRYFTQQIHGTNSGNFRGQAEFTGMVEPGTLIHVTAVSSKESAYITGFGADVVSWGK